MRPYRGPTAGGPSKATASTLCQKCLKRGHYSYECKAVAQERPYVSRPSRTQQLFNPKLVPKLTNDAPQDLMRKKGIADEELAKKELERSRGRKRSHDSDDADRPADSKRPRSTSAGSSITVSTISTRSSRSPLPRTATRGASRGLSRERDSEWRRSASVSEGETNNARRRYSEDRTEPNSRRSRRAESPKPRGRKMSRSPSRDSYSSYSSRSRSPEVPKEIARGDSRGHRHKDTSRSRSPPNRRYRGSVDEPNPQDNTYGNRSYSRERQGRQDPRRSDRSGGSAQRNEYEAAQASRAPARPTEPPRERSLSPFSQRVALTRAMNMGR